MFWGLCMGGWPFAFVLRFMRCGMKLLLLVAIVVGVPILMYNCCLPEETRTKPSGKLEQVDEEAKQMAMGEKIPEGNTSASFLAIPV